MFSIRLNLTFMILRKNINYFDTDARKKRVKALHEGHNDYHLACPYFKAAKVRIETLHNNSSFFLNSWKSALAIM